MAKDSRDHRQLHVIESDDAAASAPCRESRTPFRKKLRRAYRNPKAPPADLRWRLLFPPSMATDPKAARPMAVAAKSYAMFAANRERLREADDLAARVAVKVLAEQKKPAGERRPLKLIAADMRKPLRVVERAANRARALGLLPHHR